MSVRFLCFGEVLVRLSAPGHELLMQSPRLDACVGGAEANVAASLARFGHDVAMISVVADNGLGEAAVGELRRQGIDVRRVTKRAGRMGIYFLETGTGSRPSQVLYDRAHSAFSEMAPDNYDWSKLLDDGDVLHVSGVTPAVGSNGATAVVEAVRAARERGLHVAFDGNFRSKLWQAWGGDPQSVLAEIFANTHTAFADHRDIAMVLGCEFPGASAEHVARTSADAAFAAFPHLQRVIATRRIQHNVDHHELSAALHTRAGSIELPLQTVTPIVDRIGAGDAFAAGVLHGLFSGMSDRDALEFGLAAGCLKHSVPGDFLRLDVTEVTNFVGERRFDVRR